MCSVLCALYSVYCAVFTLKCAVCNEKRALCSVQYIVCSLHWAVFTMYCAVCNVYCAACSVQCMQNTALSFTARSGQCNMTCSEVLNCQQLARSEEDKVIFTVYGGKTKMTKNNS